MESAPGLAGLPARLKWLRVEHMRLRSPREMAKAMAEHYRGDRRRTLSHVTLWRYEDGARTPTARELYTIGEFAGINPGWLLTGRGPREANATDDYAAGVRAASLELWATVAKLWQEHGGVWSAGSPGEALDRDRTSGAARPSAEALAALFGEALAKTSR